MFEEAVAEFQSGRFIEAEEDFKEILEHYPLSPEAIEAQLMLADLYYEKQEYEEAASYYITFATFHPSHARAPYAQFQKGMCHFKEVLSPERDQTATRKAIMALNDLISLYPESLYSDKAATLVDFLRDRLAEREVYVGKFYFKKKKYKAALGRFREVIENYPDTSHVDDSLYYIGESYARLGESELASDAFLALLREYPSSPHATYAKRALGDT